MASYGHTPLHHDHIVLFGGHKQEHDSACVQALNIPLVAPSLGAVESLITRPATTTHVGMSQQERQVCLLPSRVMHRQAKAQVVCYGQTPVWLGCVSAFYLSGQVARKVIHTNSVAVHVVHW